MKLATRLWIVLAVLAVVTPLGLIISHHFKAGPAWGEWRPDTVKQMSGYVPKGLEKYSSTWKAPLPDYTFKGREEKNLKRLGLDYVFSAIAGMALCIIAGLLIGKLIAKNKTPGSGLESLRKKFSFIERTVESSLSVFKNAVTSEETASRKGLMQGLDPRFKILTVLTLLISVLFAKSPVVLAGLYSVCLTLVFCSRIRLFSFLKRTLVFIPLFSLVIIIPALFNVVTPGTPISGLPGNHTGIFITREGLVTAGIFILRVTGSVSFAVLLTSTTRHTVLLKTLRKFGVPQIFVMTLGMTYRYLYFLLSMAQNTLLAVKSRTGSGMTTATGQKIATGTLSGLWTRSVRMHDQVYKAMISRGYSGESLSYDDFGISMKDVSAFAVSLVIFTGVLWLNRFFH